MFESSPNKIIRCACLSSWCNSHKIFAPNESCHAKKLWYPEFLMMNNWLDTDNVQNVDFELYSRLRRCEWYLLRRGRSASFAYKVDFGGVIGTTLKIWIQNTTTEFSQNVDETNSHRASLRSSGCSVPHSGLSCRHSLSTQRIGLSTPTTPTSSLKIQTHGNCQRTTQRAHNGGFLKPIEAQISANHCTNSFERLLKQPLEILN